MASDLDTASVDQLFEEISKRCPAFVAAACVAEDGNTASTHTYVSGHPATCLGLSDLIHQTMRANMERSQVAEHLDNPSQENDT